MALYPLKFKPILKETLWGGQYLHQMYGKGDGNHLIGESWEISGVQDNETIVANGFLQGNSLNELVEVYMGELVGDTIYNTYGEEFPLLIKFIDAQKDLSVQVHPNDKMAKERHNAYGKTEMWYILSADADAKLINGFKDGVDKKTYLEAFNQKDLASVLNEESIQTGDSLFIPSGRVHAIGAGVVLAEIQQTSDITYRIFDWNRKDKGGKERELHTDLAIDAIDFSKQDLKPKKWECSGGMVSNLATCSYFTTNLLDLQQATLRTYDVLDSFVIYMCLEGILTIACEGVEKEMIGAGETVLIPACIDEVHLMPNNANTRLIEVYIEI